jgi:hypothetical protein
MSGLLNNSLFLSTAAAAGGYQVSRSLRFNSSDSGFLSRTPAVAGNRTTWTWAGWLKRSGTSRDVLLAQWSGLGFAFEIDSSSRIDAYDYTSGYDWHLISTPVYRDPSAWYHIVLAYDTTQATASNRIKLYVNGTQVTTFSTETYPSPSYAGYVNTASAHGIGGAFGVYLDACLAEVFFIDGQALDPSSFTEVSATTGQLIPLAYTGTYGLVSVAAATGALPIFNTTGTYGAVQGSGTRTDSNSASLVLALPLVTNANDVSNAINGASTTKTTSPSGAVASSAQSIFYGGSFLFNGSGDYIAVTDNADFAFGTGNSTVEMWVYPNTLVSNDVLYDGRQSTGGTATGFSIVVNSSGIVQTYTAGGYRCTSTSTLSVGKWSHIAVVRSSGTDTLFIDGIAQADTDTLGGNYTDQKCRIGSDVNGSEAWGGYIADFRLYKGAAKYTSNFSPVVSYNNSFHLDFADNSAATAATLGKDISGNSNNWTPNNFSVVSGTGVVTTPASNAPPTVDYLVVAGGGGGSRGGGGAGGLRSTVTATGGGGTLESPLSVIASTSYTVTVGAGGAGDPSAGSTGTNGANSVFGPITSTGGGAGAQATVAPLSGGSGGGAEQGGISGAAGTANQGFAGGDGFGSGSTRGSGGGGGAGAVGVNGASAAGGAGGAGVACSITGSSVTYGGGGGTHGISSAGAGGTGGGGAGAVSGPGGAGSANTGGGGGGGGNAGGAGGSGIVIIRYANTYDDLIVGGGLTYTYANTGGYKIYSFTASATAAQSAGNDSLVDTPTSYGTDTGVGGEVRGNYATLNPLNKASAVTLSNGNLDVVGTSWNWAMTTIAVNSGKWYWEVTHTNGGADNLFCGIAKTTFQNFTYDLNHAVSDSYNLWGYTSYFGNKEGQGSNTSYGATFQTAGDIVGCALDMDAGTITFYKNGVSQGQAFSGITAQVCPVWGGTGSSIGAANFNFGQRAFAYPLSGFKALCDTNLGAPVVAKPNELMDVALYTGNNSSLTISGFNLSPDFIWFKARSYAGSHALVDIVRGASNQLNSNLTNAESTNTAGAGLQSFNSDGFTLGTESSATGSTNGTQTYAAWMWDAGTSTVSNTDGSITSQVRANPSAGFSIVGFNSGSAGNYTVGHGLGVKPQFIITKARNGSTFNWSINHVSIATTVNKYLPFTTSATSDNGSAAWGASLADTNSTTFGISSANAVEASKDCIAYCFAPVVGYSSFGSYVGNGSSDGPFVYTGFRPAFFMVKASSTTGPWIIYDSKRPGYNPELDTLSPDSSAAEDSSGGTTNDIVSNGFKIRGTNDRNVSAVTYIYAAFAENPFQYARAR